MSDFALGREVVYGVVIREMLMHMTASCNNCPVAPCGDRQKRRTQCMDILAEHFKVPGRDIVKYDEPPIKPELKLVK